MRRKMQTGLFGVTLGVAFAWLVSLPGEARADDVDCRTLFSGLYDYFLSPPEDEHIHTVQFIFSSVKLTNAHTSADDLGFVSFGRGKFSVVSGDQVGGQFDVRFSNRKRSDRGSPFDPGRIDAQQILFDRRTGGVQVKLLSWGGAAYFLEDVRCHGDGVVTGWLKEPNGPSGVTVILHKLRTPLRLRGGGGL